MKEQNYKWVEKNISKAEWKNHHSHINSYTFLEEVDGGVKVGFLAPPYSTDLEIINPEYLRMMDMHRRANNVKPTPLETPEEKASSDHYKRKQQEGIDKLYKEVEEKAKEKDYQKHANEVIASMKQDETPLDEIPF